MINGNDRGDSEFFNILNNFIGHRNETLQKEWVEFGENSFVFEILSEIEQDETRTIDYAKESKKLAQMFIDELQPFGKKGYH